MKQSLKNVAEKEGAKFVKFYYEGSPITDNVFTACLLFGENNDLLARGVSICSLMDKHTKKKARNKAFGRAMKAMKNKNNFYPIQADREEWDRACIQLTYHGDSQKFDDEIRAYAVEVGPITENGDGTITCNYLVAYAHPVLHTNMYFEWKSEFQPEPTEEELSIFSNLFDVQTTKVL